MSNTNFNSQSSKQLPELPNLEVLRSLWPSQPSNESNDSRSVWSSRPAEPVHVLSNPTANSFTSPLKRPAPDSREAPIGRRIMIDDPRLAKPVKYDFTRHCTDYGHSYEWPYFRSVRRESLMYGPPSAVPPESPVFPPYPPESATLQSKYYPAQSDAPAAYYDRARFELQPPSKRRTLSPPPRRIVDPYGPRFTEDDPYSKSPYAMAGDRPPLSAPMYPVGYPPYGAKASSQLGADDLRGTTSRYPLMASDVRASHSPSLIDPYAHRSVADVPYADHPHYSVNAEPYSAPPPRKEKPKPRAPTPPPLNFARASEYRNDKGERISMINPRVILDESGISHRSRYFIMLCDNETAIAHAKKTSIWAVKHEAASRVSDAYKKASIYFIFIAKPTNNALGYAQVVSDLNSAELPFWADNATYAGGVRVKWIKTCNLFSAEISDIVGRMNHGMTAKDGMEMMYDEGCRLCILVNSAIMKRIGRDR
ncbi:YTH family protein Mmi1 [Schizosaccharomyces cryophilus OY26]|uniref:YTH family protein Mmi1 n=1 Tax=Schizosaccharomyces cryophilus (strain OY26 / ATCC MYA-4695 / CBS 11777 / NBRC 106824 / NRRL Y48691) TaxID=653667 RepID=S9VPX4_SCHCR|nr:YTH family protein Mmi1 [Schizosaccharomyces cryophilus OY26]EPY50008.1 YTH family protein Mmi1 [Schizosaccharomyces cryophilus OY26]